MPAAVVVVSAVVVGSCVASVVVSVEVGEVAGAVVVVESSVVAGAVDPPGPEKVTP